MLLRTLVVLSALLVLPTVSYNELMIIARIKEMRWVDLTSQDNRGTWIPVVNLTNVVAVDYDPVDKLVYWSDVGRHTINRATLDGKAQEVLFSTRVVIPDGLTLDVVGRQIYWTDTYNKLIEVAHLDGRGRRVVISEDLDSPRAIVLHKKERMLYWTDWGAAPKIECSKDDGTQRKVLVDTSLTWPNALVIDSESSRMYWGDAGANWIQSARLDGGDRKTLINNVPHVFGMTLHGDDLYWSDWETAAVEQINVKTLTDRQVKVSFITGVTVFKSFRSHGDKEFMLASGKNELREIDLGISRDLGRVLPVIGQVSAVGLAYDPITDYVYWTDQVTRRISRIFRNGGGQEVVAVSSGTPNGLVLSRTTRQLVWANAGGDKIEVVDLDGRNRQVVLNTESPRDLAIHDTERIIYWTGWGIYPKIGRFHFNGSWESVIVKGSISKPYGLTLDFSKRHIYWVDYGLNTVERCDFEGSNRMIVLSSSVRGYQGMQVGIGLDIVDEFLYLDNITDRTIVRVSINNVEERAVFMDNRTPFRGIKVVSSAGVPDDVNTKILSDQKGEGRCEAHSCQDGCTCSDLGNGRTCHCPQESAAEHTSIKRPQEQLPKGSTEEKQSPKLVFKIWDHNRKKKALIVANDIEDLKRQGREKLRLSKLRSVTLVLEEDGTVIDQDELLQFVQGKVLLLLTDDQRWSEEL